MTTGFYRETAKILQFPIGGRAGLNGLDARGALSLARLQAPKVELSVVDYGSWYHDEAIREAQLPNKPNA